MTLWLIGMMGSGKTTVGRLIAQELGVEFTDTDQEVATRAGCSVSQLWGELGESAFRDMEKAVLIRLAGSRSVVATGGGAPLDADNRELMASSGAVVWLQASAGTMAERVGHGGGRPLLRDSSDTEGELKELLRVRSGAYESVADLIVETDERSPEDVAKEAVGAWSG